MKNLLIFCLIFLGIILPWDGESSSSTSKNPNDVEKQIELKGHLSDRLPRSVLPDPIQATISSFSLNVVFLYNVGAIDVVFYATSGDIVYEANINTQTQEYISIDVSDWE
ncbi:DUF3244 domain-containing protein, partial [Maribellus maritimus]|uniref:DUF3244 domain-containing protein n=1 Tax=Maribellus maritimus TaxID=2870838 RepID=UPI001EEAE885